MRTACLMASLAGVGALAGCKRGADEETLRRLSEANDKVVSCKREVDDLKKEISSLKRQLAQAMANPGKLNLTDPEVINLIASLPANFQDAGRIQRGVCFHDARVRPTHLLPLGQTGFGGDPDGGERKFR